MQGNPSMRAHSLAYMSLLRDRIAECMKRRPDVKQADIARACKVRTPSVADWLNGKTKTLKPEPARLGAALFGCDQNWLATGTGSPNWEGGSARQAAPEVSLADALGVLGRHLAADMDRDTRAELGDALQSWARWHGKDSYLDNVASLLAKAGPGAQAPTVAPAVEPPRPDFSSQRNNDVSRTFKPKEAAPERTPPAVVRRGS
jgi:hypothetical protein